MDNNNLIKQAQNLIEGGKPQEAIPIFQSLLESNPNNHLLWFLLGRTYDMIGEKTYAIKCLLKSSKLNKGFWDGYLYLAQIYVNSNDLNNIKKYINKVLDINPELASAWALLGVAYGKSKIHSKALECFLKANKLDPTDEQIQRNLSMTRAKMAKEQLRRNGVPRVSMTFFGDGLDITDEVEKSRREFEKDPSKFDDLFPGPHLKLSNDDEEEEKVDSKQEFLDNFWKDLQKAREDAYRRVSEQTNYFKSLDTSKLVDFEYEDEEDEEEPHYKIGFFYEWGGHMFWARNDNTSEKFGSPIDPLKLPIPSEYAQKFKELNYLWEKLNRKDSEYSSQYSDWERLFRETGELLEKTAKELGPEFILCEDFDCYMNVWKKLHELDGDISKSRVKALLNEAISRRDEKII